MENIICKAKITTNVLFYGSHQCINDRLIELMMLRYGVKRSRQIHYKDIIYRETPHFFIFDACNNENMMDCIKELIKNHSIQDRRRHIVIILNIERLLPLFFAFRILLERFYNTTQFICTTLSIANIERPIQSRFFLVRQPHDQPMFNTIEMITTIKKKPSVDEITRMSYKIKDHGLNDIILSALKVTPYKKEYIEVASYIENMFVRSKKPDKRATIELLLIELFYPSHKHIL